MKYLQLFNYFCFPSATSVAMGAKAELGNQQAATKVDLVSLSPSLFMGAVVF